MAKSKPRKPKPQDPALLGDFIRMRFNDGLKPSRISQRHHIEMSVVLKELEGLYKARKVHVPESLLDAYRRKEMSGIDIANKLGVDRGVVYRYFKEVGLRVRQHKRKVRVRFTQTRDWLYEQIHVHGRLLREIGKDFNLGPTSMVQICKELGVPVGRVRKERNVALKIATTCPECGGSKNRASKGCQKCLFARKAEKKLSRAAMVFCCPCGGKKAEKAKTCRRCFAASIRGDRNPKYLKDRTNINEYRADRTKAEYIDWQKAVYKKDGYMCGICGSNRKLNAHHLESFARNKALRFVIENGVTLCVRHHNQFHSWYGKNANSAKFLAYSESMRM